MHLQAYMRDFDPSLHLVLIWKVHTEMDRAAYLAFKTTSRFRDMYTLLLDDGLRRDQG